MTQETKSHFFAVRTTGGQEKVVMGLLENRIKLKKLNIQSVLLLENLKGYVVVEAIDANAAFDALQGIRHIRGRMDIYDKVQFLVRNAGRKPAKTPRYIEQNKRSFI